MQTALIDSDRMGVRHLEVVRSLKLDLVGVSDIQEQARAKREDAH